jgi:hypothetical protein
MDNSATDGVPPYPCDQQKNRQKNFCLSGRTGIFRYRWRFTLGTANKRVKKTSLICAVIIEIPARWRFTLPLGTANKKAEKTFFLYERS